MRHLAKRRQAAGPAIRTRRLAIPVGTLVLVTLLSAARGDAPPVDWWASTSGAPSSLSGERASLGKLSISNVPNLSEELFGAPGNHRTAFVNSYHGPYRDAHVEPARYVDGDWFDAAPHAESAYDETWCHQVLPDGLIYRSYLAGVKEPRFAGQWVHDVNLGWIWDITLGGRVGILRYGTTNADHPEGWQLDMEGAGMPRLDLEHQRDLMAADFRFGVPLTYGRGSYQSKFGYYHLSSHLGDEYMVRHATLVRRNYSRDVIVWGHSYFLTEDIRLYGEAGWAFNYDGGTEPWEFQFGIDYSPVKPTGQRGSPFFAINGHLRQEFDFGGNLVVQTGWQWRGYSGHLFRIGMHYFQGMSDQWEFFDQYEDKLGFGIWYDF